MYEIFVVNFWVIILYPVLVHKNLINLKNLKNLKTFCKQPRFFQPWP